MPETPGSESPIARPGSHRRGITLPKAVAPNTTDRSLLRRSRHAVVPAQRRDQPSRWNTGGRRAHHCSCGLLARCARKLLPSQIVLWTLAGRNRHARHAAESVPSPAFGDASAGRPDYTVARSKRSLARGPITVCGSGDTGDLQPARRNVWRTRPAGTRCSDPSISSGVKALGI